MIPSISPSSKPEENFMATPLYFSSLHPDIIKSHILTRLDGPTLASAASSSASLRRLCSGQKLWSHLCSSTWPSTSSSPRLTQLISSFPNGGPQSFFSQSFPLPLLGPTPHTNRTVSSLKITEFISAVDILLNGKIIFSKIQETETETGWFRCSPFRIDLLEPKDVVPIPIERPDSDGACLSLLSNMTLSWIVVDPTGGRAVNLSSHVPVSVQRNWLSGEVQVRFAAVLGVGKGRRVQMGTVVTCGVTEGGEVQLREVTMEAEDLEGMHLTGRDSLVILEGALGGKKGNAWNREEEGRRRYKEYLEMKQRRKERKVRMEGALDSMCVGFGICIFVAFWGFLWGKL